MEDFNQDLPGEDAASTAFNRYGICRFLFTSFTRLHNPSLPGLSKLANLLFTKELQRRLDADGSSVTAIAVHPGGIRTGTFLFRE